MKLIKTIFFAALLLQPFLGISQSQEEHTCIQLGMERMDAQEHWMREAKKSFSISKSLDDTICRHYPLSVHILHEGEEVGTGHNLSDAQVESAITSLNLYWNNEGIYHVDTGTAFPQTFSLDTINRINLAEIYPYYPESGINTGNVSNPDIGVATGTIRNYVDFVQGFDRDSVFNVFVYNQVGSGNILGFAWLGNIANGVWVKSAEFGDQAFAPEGEFFYGFPNGLTTVHEMGHIFVLRHTFQSTDPNCPVPETNCAIQGDLVCDTPQQSQRWGCGPICGNPPDGNHMGYMWCRYLFTPGQLERALLGEANPFNHFDNYTRCEPEEPPVEPVWPYLSDVILSNCDSQTEIVFKTLDTDSVTHWKAQVVYNFIDGDETNDSTVTLFDEPFPDIVDSVVTSHYFDLGNCNLCLVDVSLIQNDSVIASTSEKIECIVDLDIPDEDLECGFYIENGYLYGNGGVFKVMDLTYNIIEDEGTDPWLIPATGVYIIKSEPDCIFPLYITVL